MISGSHDSSVLMSILLLGDSTMGLVLQMFFSGTKGSKMGRRCWGASFFFANLMKIGHLLYTTKISGCCFYEGRVTCSLSVFESRVLSVILKHKRELIIGESSRVYYDNCHNLYSSSSLGCLDGKGM